MLGVVLYGFKVGGDVDAVLERWRRHDAVRRELAALREALMAQPPTLHREVRLPKEVPLVGHATYSRDELVAAFDLRSKEGHLYGPQTGVVLVPSTRHELLLVTLDKSAKTKLPHLQYRDYAISEAEFHWESQADTTTRSEQGQRHIRPEATGVTPMLLVRRRSKDERGLGEPYVLLGPAKYLRHEGERPIAVTWHLEVPMPATLLHEARAAVA
jgi:hypothetical protein